MLNFKTLEVQPNLHKITGQFLTGQKGSPLPVLLNQAYLFQIIGTNVIPEEST